MEIFIKTVAGVLVALVMYLAIGQKGKDLGGMLILTVCIMTAAVALSFLKPVISFFSRLQSLIGLNNELLSILLKAVGTGIVGEIASALCTDGGQASLGKVIQLLTTCVILWISLPLFTEVLNLIEEILKNI